VKGRFEKQVDEGGSLPGKKIKLRNESGYQHQYQDSKE
jgi:hypothetical protein